MVQLAFDMFMVVTAVAAPTVEMIVLKIESMGLLPSSLPWVMEPELPALKKSQLQNKMKQPPTIRVKEAGWSPILICRSNASMYDSISESENSVNSGCYSRKWVNLFWA